MGHAEGNEREQRTIARGSVAHAETRDVNLGAIERSLAKAWVLYENACRLEAERCFGAAKKMKIRAWARLRTADRRLSVL